jgi:hypothetical protein
MVTDFIKKNKIIFFVLFMVAYFWKIREYVGVFEQFHRGDFFIIVITLAYFGWDAIVFREKHSSPQLQLPNEHTSLGMSPVEFTDDDDFSYTIFRAGGYIGEIFPNEKGNEGVYVVPSILLYKLGSNYTASAIPEATHIDDLPNFAKKWIQHHNLKPPYYLCIVPELYSGIVTKSIKNIQEIANSYRLKILSQARIINELKDVIENKWEVITVFNDKASNASQSFNKPPSEPSSIKKFFGGQ